MIPKIIHQIWIGPNPLPDKCKNYVKTWKKHHPSWEYKFWDNANTEELLSEASEKAVNAYNHHSSINPAMFAPACQADIIRYLAILKYGGVYVDIDFECYKPIDELILDKKLIVASPNSRVHWVCNGFFGATPNHEVIKEAVDDLEPRGKARNGPTYLTKHFKNFIDCNFMDSFEATQRQVGQANAQGKKVKLVEAQYLFARSTRFPDSYAYHHPLMSWQPRNSISNQSDAR